MILSIFMKIKSELPLQVEEFALNSLNITFW